MARVSIYVGYKKPSAGEIRVPNETYIVNYIKLFFMWVYVRSHLYSLYMTNQMLRIETNGGLF